jgi:pimeloyl-ACP methyl ester carboxylesterase
MKKLLLLLLSTLYISSYAQSTPDYYSELSIALDTLKYYDILRDRIIPIAIYKTKEKNKESNIPVIINHGWGQNKGGDYLFYSYLSTCLATQGYTVISIQHEQTNDPMLAMEGNFIETRMPNWQQRVKNIEVVLQHLKKDYPKLQYDKLVLIGHSNGGDMVNLYTQLYPDGVHTLITLDNRRMPLPRTLHTHVFSLRSNDFPADEGVLPTEQEAMAYNITVQATDINHGQMDDKANAEQRAYICTKLSEYLKH